MAKQKPKTDTIKERAIYIYLPSIETTRRWKELAKKAGTSISKFVIEHVENSLRQEEGDYKPRIDLINKIEKLEEENSELRKERRMLGIVVERLESELKHYRAKPFLEERFEGVRKYEKDLVDLLRKRRKVMSDEILDAMNIDPKDSELVKAVNRQLENLEGYGLVKVIPGGWKWTG